MNKSSADGEAIDNNLPSIGKDVEIFIRLINSLSNTLPLTIIALIDAFEDTQEAFKKFEKENMVYEREDNVVRIKIKTDCLRRFRELRKKLITHGLAFKTIPNSYFVSLISQYDAFLGGIIRSLYTIKPQLLLSSEKNFSLSQLLEFGSIEEAKEFILEKEVETVIRKSHLEQFQWMENKFGVALRKNLDVFPDFIEITERRNLFVHTGGIISTQYLKVCRENGVNFPEELKVGDEISVHPEYFDHAYKVIFEIGFKLAHVLWRKFIPEERELADKNLIEIGYDTLYEEKYDLTKMIFDFAIDVLRNYSNEERRRVMIVNRALAYKWSGDRDKARDIINGEDWSATRGKFRLAQAVLLDDYLQAFKLMREIGINNDEIKKEDYREWPLFKEFRQNEEFMSVFEEIFDEPLSKIDENAVSSTGFSASFLEADNNHASEDNNNLH